jgi:hypothetical protein
MGQNASAGLGDLVKIAVLVAAVVGGAIYGPAYLEYARATIRLERSIDACKGLAKVASQDAHNDCHQHLVSVLTPILGQEPTVDIMVIKGVARANISVAWDRKIPTGKVLHFKLRNSVTAERAASWGQN